MVWDGNNFFTIRPVLSVLMLENTVSLLAACSFSLGLGEDSIHASSVFVMPVVSSRMTGFRGTGFVVQSIFP